MVAGILKNAEQIALKNMEQGKYFRIAADVIVDGESLGDILVDVGVAARMMAERKYINGVRRKNETINSNNLGAVTDARIRLCR